MRNKQPMLAYEQAVENHSKEVEAIYKKAARAEPRWVGAINWVCELEWLFAIPFGLILAAVMIPFTRWYLQAKGVGLGESLSKLSLWGVWAGGLVASCLLFGLFIFFLGFLFHQYGNQPATEEEVKDLAAVASEYPRIQEQIKRVIVENEGLGLTRRQCRVLANHARRLSVLDRYEADRLKALEVLEEKFGVVSQARAQCRQEKLEKNWAPKQEGIASSTKARL